MALKHPVILWAIAFFLISMGLALIYSWEISQMIQKIENGIWEWWVK